MQTYTAEESKRIAMRVSWISLMINLLLSAFKLVAGLVASSGAMISDAIHSASDVFSTIIVMMASRSPAARPTSSTSTGTSASSPSPRSPWPSSCWRPAC